MRKTLIIGATSAIATEIAKRCASRGESLVLVGRNEGRLAALASSLGGAVVAHIASDFLDTSRAESIVKQADEVLDGLDSVFIVHGDLGDQLESERSFTEAERVIRVNLLSVLAFVIPIANLFEARGRGSLVIFSSVAGDRGRPRNYTYGSAKGALSLYLQGVRSRLYGKGVRICTIRLGPVDTPMTRDHEKNLLFAAAGDVADTVLRVRDAGPEDVYVPWYWQPIMTTVRRLPEWIFQRLRFLSGR
ncbi:MAG: SDR family NAD(P)-dependent oxidoreductase [Polyangiaceae bacterium]